MPRKRFTVESQDDGWSVGFIIRDNTTGAEYYAGGGEPEDQTITRDWAWVLDLLNEMADEIDSLYEALG